MISISLDELKKSVQMAIQYVHSCQTEDGGYFFARIAPSSLQDTFFAVQILRMLGQKPRRKKELENFVLSFQEDYEDGNIHALYLAAGTLSTHSRANKILQVAGKSAFEDFKIPRLFDELDVEVVSELKTVFEAISLFLHFDLPVDRDEVTRFILLLKNADGGFGREGHSTLATTYYALRTLALMDHQRQTRGRITKFLKTKEQAVFFIEDLYYLSQIRSLLGNPSFVMEREQFISYILDYQGTKGGFARSRIMGIQTLEYTYYAASLLKLTGAI